MTISLLAFLLLTFLLILLVAYAAYLRPGRQVGYIPLPDRGIAAVMKALALTSGSRFFDLGCGDGRVIAAALQHRLDATGVGIEFHPIVARLARWRLRRLQPGRIRIIRGDILQQDLRPATHLFAYLNHPTMALLEPKLKRELKPGAHLVSCDFPLPHTQPTKTIKIGEPWQLGQTLYIYEYK